MPEHEVQQILRELGGIDAKLDRALEQSADHETRIRKLENKGGKRLDKIVDFVLAAGVGALVTAIVAKLIEG